MSDKEIISELEDALAMAEATIKESRDSQRRLGNSVATLRAELERVRGERDVARQAASAWKRSAKMWRAIAANATMFDAISMWKTEAPYHDAGKWRKHRGVVNE